MLGCLQAVNIRKAAKAFREYDTFQNSEAPKGGFDAVLTDPTESVKCLSLKSFRSIPLFKLTLPGIGDSSNFLYRLPSSSVLWCKVIRIELRSSAEKTGGITGLCSSLEVNRSSVNSKLSSVSCRSSHFRGYRVSLSGHKPERGRGFLPPGWYIAV